MENNTEKTKSSIKRRLIITLFSALICILVIGVSVYAALSQTVELNNNITITTAGQTKVAVAVSQASNEATTGVSASPADEPSVAWASVGTKDADADSQTISGLTPMDFSVEDGVNYYAYKFEFTNSGSTIAYAHITSESAIDNTQLTIYTGETWGSLTALTNNKTINDTVELEAADGTGTYYVVVAANADLASLNNMNQTAFNLDVLIDQNA